MKKKMGKGISWVLVVALLLSAFGSMAVFGEGVSLPVIEDNTGALEGTEDSGIEEDLGMEEDTVEDNGLEEEDTDVDGGMEGDVAEEEVEAALLAAPLALSAFQKLELTNKWDYFVDDTARVQYYDFKTELPSGHKVKITTDIKPTYATSSENGTLTAGSRIEESVNCGFAIDSITLGNITGTGDVSISLNGSADSWKKDTVANVTGKTFDFTTETSSVTSYKIVFEGQVKLDTEKSVQSFFTTNPENKQVHDGVSTLKVSVNGYKEETERKIAHKKVTTGLVFSKMIVNSFLGDKLDVPEHIYSNQMLPEQVRYSYGGVAPFAGHLAKDQFGMYSPTVLFGNTAVYNTSFVSTPQEDLLLKNLTIDAGVVGQGMVENLDAKNTYQLLVDGKPQKNDAEGGYDFYAEKGYSIDFDGKTYHTFSIKIPDGTIFRVANADSGKGIVADYNIRKGATARNYNADLVVTTAIGNQVVTNQDAGMKRAAAYFLKEAGMRNYAEKAEYNVGEDIVFTLDEMNLGRFIGDYSRNYFRHETSINLSDYYYLKEVVVESNLKNCILEGEKVIYIKGKTVPDKDWLKEVLPANGVITTFQNTGDDREIYDSIKFFGDNFLIYNIVGGENGAGGVTDYEIGNALSGALASGVKIKLVYAPKEGKEIKEEMIFQNTLKFLVTATANPNDLKKWEANIVGTTKIVLPKEETSPSNPSQDNKPEGGGKEEGKEEGGKEEGKEEGKDEGEKEEGKDEGNTEGGGTEGGGTEGGGTEGGTGGTDSTPPTPSNPSESLVPQEDGTFLVINENGVPLGSWKKHPVTQVWEFFPAEVPMSEIPETRDERQLPLFGALLLASAGALCVFQKRRKKA